MLHRWHRRIGALASLFVLWMIVSGWLLNHTDALGLAHRLVTAAPVARLYDLGTGAPDRIFVDGGHWLAAGTDALVLDGHRLDVPLAHPLGLVAGSGVVFAVGEAELLVIDPDGALVDRVPADLLPVAHVTRVGAGCDGAVIQDGGRTLATPDGVAWSACPPDRVHWSVTVTPSPAQASAAAALLRPGVSWERLLEDSHSGRIFGRWGVYAVDGVGIGLALLALSGLWMFFRDRRLRRGKPSPRRPLSS